MKTLDDLKSLSPLPIPMASWAMPIRWMEPPYAPELIEFIRVTQCITLDAFVVPDASQARADGFKALMRATPGCKLVLAYQPYSQLRYRADEANHNIPPRFGPAEIAEISLFQERLSASIEMLGMVPDMVFLDFERCTGEAGPGAAPLLAMLAPFHAVVHEACAGKPFSVTWWEQGAWTPNHGQTPMAWAKKNFFPPGMPSDGASIVLDQIQDEGVTQRQLKDGQVVFTAIVWVALGCGYVRSMGSISSYVNGREIDPTFPYTCGKLLRNRAFPWLGSFAPPQEMGHPFWDDWYWFVRGANGQ